MTNVTVIVGDITKVEADALIAPISACGPWAGEIDYAIMQAAGQQFHDQVAARKQLEDGDVVDALDLNDSKPPFGSVLFVIDEMRRSLYGVVNDALWAAEHHHLQTVSMSLFRTNAAAGIRGTVHHAIEHFVRGIGDFLIAKPARVRELKLAVYDEELADDLRECFSHLTVCMHSNFDEP